MSLLKQGSIFGIIIFESIRIRNITFGRTGAMWSHEIEKRDVDHEKLYSKIFALQPSSLFPLPGEFSAFFLNI